MMKILWKIYHKKDFDVDDLFRGENEGIDGGKSFLISWFNTSRVNKNLFFTHIDILYIDVCWCLKNKELDKKFILW